MSGIEFEGRSYPYREGETVLDALVRGGAPVAYSCRRGTCQTCVLQLEGDVTATTLIQSRLPRARLDAGTFLACQTRAAPVSVKRLERNALFVPARLVDKTQVGSDILRIRLEPPGSFMWHPGQYVNIRHPDGALRAYAVTSLAAIDYWLELHVQWVPNGIVSSWLRDELAVGQFLELQGPFGDSHYQPWMLDHQLVLIASDIAAATLVGIARDAALRGHTQPARLYHGARKITNVQLTTWLQSQLSQHPNLTVVECTPDVTNTSHPDRALPLADHAFAHFEPLANTTIFLCGEPAMVQAGQTLALERGAGMQNIRTLAFEF